MRVVPMFAWYDFWVGIFWDRAKLRLYVFPVPMFGLRITWGGSVVTRKLKPDEAAAVMGMSPMTLAGWRASGFGPSWAGFGGSVRYDSERLEEWMNQRERRPSNVDTSERRKALTKWNWQRCQGTSANGAS